MARRHTYIYRVEIGDPPTLTDFCYARNAAAAVDGMKPLYPTQSRFRAIPVGENRNAAFTYRKIEGAELEYLRLNKGKIGEKYTYVKTTPMPLDILGKGTFVPKEALHESDLL